MPDQHLRYDPKALTAEQFVTLMDRSHPQYRRKADELWLASEIVLEQVTGAWKAIMRNVKKSGMCRDSKLHRLHDLHSVAAMLRAMSIEDDLKAVFYLQQTITGKHLLDEDIADPDRGHRLLQLAIAIGLPLTPRRQNQLSSLEDMILLGRYPARTYPVKGTNLKQGITNFGTSPAADRRLRRSIHLMYEKLAAKASKLLTLRETEGHGTR